MHAKRKGGKEGARQLNNQLLSNIFVPWPCPRVFYPSLAWCPRSLETPPCFASIARRSVWPGPRLPHAVERPPRLDLTLILPLSLFFTFSTGGWPGPRLPDAAARPPAAFGAGLRPPLRRAAHELGVPLLRGHPGLRRPPGPARHQRRPQGSRHAGVYSLYS